jgi:hypothetical protein
MPAFTSSTALNSRTSSGACSWCRVYGNSQHLSTCTPGRRLPVGRMRRAQKDSRTSAAALANHRLQQFLARDR